MKTACLVRDDRTASQIAQTITQAVQQGKPSTGVLYFDSTGNPCDSGQKAFIARETVQTMPDNALLNRLTLTVVPVGAPDRARHYALVFQAP